MRYEEWEPIYEEIAKEFGFSRMADEESASLLDSLVKYEKLCDGSCLQHAIGLEATVCGDGPNLLRDLEGFSPRGTLLAADGATSKLMSRRIWPDIIVSDLDGEIEPQILANEMGAIIVILGHGDNEDRVRDVVPRLQGRISPTTQVRPHGRLANYGGFTDGDRAVELARHFGARKINLIGFDFANPTRDAAKDAERKKRKLEWARKIIWDMNPPQVVLWTP